MPDDDFPKSRWKLWVSLAVLVFGLLGMGLYRLLPPVYPKAYWPPLSAEEARQALVEFAAEEPLVAPYTADYKAVPEEITSDRGNGIIYFGLYECDLHSRGFRFPVTNKLLSSGLGGRFVYENGVWKAKLGAPPDGRFTHWAG